MLEHEGKLYARVSDILKPFVNFGNVDPLVLERKAALGTRIHEAINQEIKGELPVVLREEQGYFKSFELWRSALKPTFVTTEERIYCNQKMLTGCIDGLIKLQGEEECVLVDWKTSACESPITWPMQAHLYFYLIIASGRDIAKRFLFIKLDRHGRLPKVFTYNFDPMIFSKCLQAVEAFWIEKKEKVLR
jgi:hypothetical protein